MKNAGCHSLRNATVDRGRTTLYILCAINERTKTYEMKMEKLLGVIFIVGIALVISAVVYKLSMIPHDHGERLVFFASERYDHVQLRARLLSFAGFGLFFGSMVTKFIIAKLAGKKH
ncbi:MAG: hypothetical protein ACE5D4_01345 [Thermodesulfobacteriota bacterium]